MNPIHLNDSTQTNSLTITPFESVLNSGRLNDRIEPVVSSNLNQGPSNHISSSSSYLNSSSFETSSQPSPSSNNKNNKPLNVDQPSSQNSSSHSTSSGSFMYSSQISDPLLEPSKEFAEQGLTNNTNNNNVFGNGQSQFQNSFSYPDLSSFSTDEINNLATSLLNPQSNNSMPNNFQMDGSQPEDLDLSWFNESYLSEDTSSKKSKNNPDDNGVPEYNQSQFQNNSTNQVPASLFLQQGSTNNNQQTSISHSSSSTILPPSTQLSQVDTTPSFRVVECRGNIPKEWVEEFIKYFYIGDNKNIRFALEMVGRFPEESLNLDYNNISNEAEHLEYMEFINSNKLRSPECRRGFIQQYLERKGLLYSQTRLPFELSNVQARSSFVNVIYSLQDRLFYIPSLAPIGTVYSSLYVIGVNRIPEKFIKDFVDYIYKDGENKNIKSILEEIGRTCSNATPPQQVNQECQMYIETNNLNNPDVCKNMVQGFLVNNTKTLIPFSRKEVLMDPSFLATLTIPSTASKRKRDSDGPPIEYGKDGLPNILPSRYRDGFVKFLYQGGDASIIAIAKEIAFNLLVNVIKVRRLNFTLDKKGVIEHVFAEKWDNVQKNREKAKIYIESLKLDQDE